MLHVRTLLAIFLAVNALPAFAQSLPSADSAAFIFDALVVAADTDGDGMPDAWETSHGLNPAINDSLADPDGDGANNITEYNRGSHPNIGDFPELSLVGSGLFTYDGQDLLPDQDGDGIPDSLEVIYGLNPAVSDSASDSDGDGLTALEEYNGGWDPNLNSSGQTSRMETSLVLLDTGAYPAGFSSDGDADNMPDWWEDKYGLQLGLNDAAANPDSDELTNIEEYQAGRNPMFDDRFGEGADEGADFIADTAGRKLDTDGDLMPDDWEITYGLNPNVVDALDDPDSDGVNNLEEYNAGSNPQVHEHPELQRLASSTHLLDTGAYPQSYSYDGDSDGIPDWWEVKYGFSIATNSALGNPDNDSYNNLEEYQAGLHPQQKDFVFIINADGMAFLLDTGGKLTDSDSDGIPNWWEVKYTGDAFVMNAVVDTDNDGQSNYDEYLAGLNPMDAQSVFKVEQIEADNGANFSVTWQTQPGRTYYLYFSDTPSHLNGEPSHTVTGDGTLQMRSVPKDGKKSMFCRVAVEVN